MRKIIIKDEVFEKFPTFTRGVIIITRMDNFTENPKILELLKNESERISGSDFLSHENIMAWDQAHKVFGSNPNRYPPSIKALVKRMRKGPPPQYINSAVALFNYVSLKYLLPCGGDDVEKIQGDLCLGPAEGNEKFIPLGGSEPEQPEKGEIIYYDSQTLNVMCRRWNWRNGDFTKISKESRKIVINIDGIAPGSEQAVLSARDEMAGILIKECKAGLQSDLMVKGKNSIVIDI